MVKLLQMTLIYGINNQAQFLNQLNIVVLYFENVAGNII